MKMDAGLDTGPILSQRKISIDSRETTGALTERISKLCAKVTLEDIPSYVRGELSKVPQENQLATWAPPIRAEDRRLNFADAASTLDARIRAMSPSPSAITTCKGRLLRILDAIALAEDSGGDPGTVRISPDRRIVVSTRAGSLELRRAQLEGRKPLDARDLINGRTLADGDRLGDSLN
jgi:methionyl-tRNA formyltransferase